MKGEPYVVVIIDNISVHMVLEVKETIERAGLHIFPTATYSQNLNPIEKMFSVYNVRLKKNGELNWLQRHSRQHLRWIVR